MNQLRRRIKLLLVTATVVLIIAGVHARLRSRASAGGSSVLESELTSLLKRYPIPGAEGAIISSEGIIEAKAIGIRKLGSNEQLTVNDLMHLGSNTKAMTAMAIMSLVEDKKLSLETTPLEAFPELKGSIHPEYTHITLAQLLCHTAGVPAFNRQWETFRNPVTKGTPVQERRSFALEMLRRGPNGKAGVFQYSNAGYGIATAMVEEITGQSWEALLRTRLFEALCVRGEFGWPALNDPNQPWGHWIRGREVIPQAPDSTPIYAGCHPGGNVSMSLLDYAKFIQIILQGMKGSDGVLKAATMQRIHTTEGYSFGWGVMRLDGTLTSWHNGSAGMFFTVVFLQAAQNRAVVLLMNGSSGEVQQAAEAACKQVLAASKEAGP